MLDDADSTDKQAAILIQLTPLTTLGGARGIGRYTRELARGFTELPKEALAHGDASDARVSLRP